MKKKRCLVPLLAIIGIGTIAPSYVRVYRVNGSSDAPSFLVGDRILLFKSAYDIRLPYSNAVIRSYAQPKRGDVVMFRSPEEDYLVFKRVVGCPGDTILMRENRLEINGMTLTYERVDISGYEFAAGSNNLGTVIEEESGNGPTHLITHTPGKHSGTTLGPVYVGEEQYYVIGDNRDNSRDSRAYGAIPRDSILGKVVRIQRTSDSD